MNVAGEEYRSNRIHPLKFALWISMASMSMVFIAFTSAYIVKRSSGSWLEFPLPSAFYISTAAILLGSLALQFAIRFFKKREEVKYKGALVFSFLTGLTFIYFQYKGWMEMYEVMELPLATNAASDFMYVITWAHAAHVIGGIAAIILALVHAFILPFKLTKTRLTRLELTATFWHFVDFLWVFLLIFFITQGAY